MVGISYCFIIFDKRLSETWPTLFKKTDIRVRVAKCSSNVFVKQFLQYIYLNTSLKRSYETYLTKLDTVLQI